MLGQTVLGFVAMTLAAHLRDQAVVQQARMGAMRRFLLEMSAAEAVHAKCLNKAADRLQKFLASSKHTPGMQAPGYIRESQVPLLPDEDVEPSRAFSEVLNTVSHEAKAAAAHSKCANESYAQAAARLKTLISDYQIDSKAAISRVNNSAKVVQVAEARMEATSAAHEIVQASGTTNLDIDPWLSELSQQCAGNHLMTSMCQHKVHVQSASQDFNECEAAGKRRFLDAVADGLSQARQQSENKSIALQQACVFVRGSKLAREEDNTWLRAEANDSLARIQAALDMVQQTSVNALASKDIVCRGMVDRPGVKNMLWSKQYAVITSAGYMHLFDPSAACMRQEEALPHLHALPCSSIPLRDCTVALSGHTPTSLKVEVTAHSKVFPATKYTLKLGSEEEIVEWTVALKDCIPKDSIWAERIQRTEDTKNHKFLEKQRRGGC